MIQIVKEALQLGQQRNVRLSEQNCGRLFTES
jgi:hypothetical protein